MYAPIDRNTFLMVLPKDPQMKFALSVTMTESGKSWQIDRPERVPPWDDYSGTLAMSAIVTKCDGVIHELRELPEDTILWLVINCRVPGFNCKYSGFLDSAIIVAGPEEAAVELDKLIMGMLTNKMVLPKATPAYKAWSFEVGQLKSL